MKISCIWKEGMLFKASNSKNLVGMDAKRPIGGESEMTPKELVIAGLCGCTAMDVVGLMKKHKQIFKSFDVTADVTTSAGAHPAVFTEITMLFKMQGEVEPQVLLDAVNLSQTKYCGVSAMLSKAVPINYRVELNHEEIGQGTAHF